MSNLSRDQAVKLADAANARLRDLYSEILPKWQSLAGYLIGGKHVLSTPLFINVQPEYYLSSRRLVFVGQETHGWDTERNEKLDLLTVEEITDFYKKWRPVLFHKYPSPYWQALRELCNRIPVAESESAIIFSNLFISDVDKGQGPKEALDAMRNWNVLPRELDILEPDHVVFFSGRVYAWNLHYYFQSELAGSLTPHAPVLAYQPTGASWTASVTYHPNYLRRNRARWAMAMNQLTEQATRKADLSSTDSRRL